MMRSNSQEALNPGALEPVQNIQQENTLNTQLITIYKNAHTTFDERMNLLKSLTNAGINELYQFYLDAFADTSRRMEEIAHPAAQPCLALIEELRTNKRSKSENLKIIHLTLDLANAPVGTPEFYQASTRYQAYTESLQKDAKNYRLHGIISLVGIGLLAVGVLVAIGILALPAIALLPAISIIPAAGGLGFAGVIHGIISFSMFKSARETTVLMNKMNQVDEALQENQQEPHAPPLYQNH